MSSLSVVWIAAHNLLSSRL
jgi:glycine/D-amino acid oxidase-like deaminating enzyme